MDAIAIEQQFSQKVAKEISLTAEGDDRYVVFTPFMFDDGDHLVIALKHRDGKWELSDEGHTYMHLSYEVDEADMFKGTRGKIIANTLAMFDVKDREGELAIDVIDDDYGEALFAFVQALLKIADVTYLSRDRARRTFLDDLKDFMTETVPRERMQFSWYAPHDESRKYRVDCRVNGMQRPLFVYALNNDTRTRDVTIALHQFLNWGIEFEPVGVFQDVHAIGGKVLERFNDVCPSQNQFVKFKEERGQFAEYLQKAMRSAAGKMG